jgi:hypothetical protein
MDQPPTRRFWAYCRQTGNYPETAFEVIRARAALPNSPTRKLVLTVQAKHGGLEIAAQI